MENSSEKYGRWKYYATVAVCILSVGAVAYLLFKYALPIIAPFLVALAVGSVVSPVASYLSGKTKVPRCVWGAVLTVILLGLIITLTVLAFDRLAGELIHLAENLGSESGRSMVDGVVDYASNLTSRLPVLRELRASMGDEGFWDDIDGMLADSITDTFVGFAAKIPEFLARMAAALPEIFVTLTVTLIATFYFSAGRGREQLTEIIPRSARGKMTELKGRLKPALVGWLRAYFLIFLITFVELFLGLSLLKVKYAFLFAALIALVDFLPIFGTGTVLVPWSVVSFFMKDIKLGIGILALYIVTVIVRESLEPRIVGKSLGISPLLSLISTYAGLKLFGFVGMIVAPAAAMLAVAAVGGENKKTVDKSPKI